MIKLNELMDKMNYNKMAREKNDKSILSDIEKDLIEAFVNMKNKTDEMKQSFDANLITSSQVFDNPEMYKGVDHIGTVYAFAQAEYANQYANEVTVQTVEAGRSR